MTARLQSAAATVELPFPTCVLPGCDTPVADSTQPCTDCLAAFGDMLRPTNRPLTPEQITERDLQVRDAYRLQAEVAAAAGRRVAVDAGEIKKPGQVCWLCEERRACTKTAQGWECDACREMPA